MTSGSAVQRILITGASRGIGRAIAHGLAAPDRELVLGYREREEAAQQTRGLVLAAGGNARLLALDVADRAGCAALLEREQEVHGPFWGVVLNAGVAADVPFAGMEPADWDRVLRTNLDGFYNVLRPLVMGMLRARRGGRIVTLSSVAGLLGNRGQVNYSASKAGLIGATRALARELAKRQITVNCVAPGLIETEMTADVPLAEVLPAIPLGRIGQPEEVAAAVRFLLSEDAGYITAQVLSVNGGMAV
jgi:3-oxoacyl-[acyl-carrier protein] reductase